MHPCSSDSDVQQTVHATSNSNQRISHSCTQHKSEDALFYYSFNNKQTNILHELQTLHILQKNFTWLLTFFLHKARRHKEPAHRSLRVAPFYDDDDRFQMNFNHLPPVVSSVVLSALPPLRWKLNAFVLLPKKVIFTSHVLQELSLGNQRCNTWIQLAFIYHYVQWLTVFWRILLFAQRFTWHYIH